MDEIVIAEFDYQSLRLELEQWADRCQYLFGMQKLFSPSANQELIKQANNLLLHQTKRAELDSCFGAYLDSLSVDHPLRKWEGARFTDLNARLDLITERLNELKP